MPPSNTNSYDLADRLYQLAPWEWMEETALIALDDPETGFRHHISVMGMAGNHHSIALYLGPVARQRFNLIQERNLPQEDTLGLILDTPQLQCSFSERSDLFQSELADIKRAGKKYRGENWPSFRAFRPGCCPGPTSDQETRLLLTAVEQVLEVAPALEFGQDTFRHQNGGMEILTRSCVGGVWQTVWMADHSGSLFSFPQPDPEPFLVEKVRRYETALPVEVHFQIMPNPVGKTRETSVFPYLLLVVEPKSHFVLGIKMLTINDVSHDALISSVPTELLKICDTNSIRPASFAVASPATHALMVKTADTLGITCHLRNHLSAIDEALESLMGFIG